VLRPHARAPLGQLKKALFGRPRLTLLVACVSVTALLVPTAVGHAGTQLQFAKQDRLQVKVAHESGWAATSVPAPANMTPSALGMPGTWYQSRCYTTSPRVTAALAGRNAWYMQFTYHWCAATTTPTGPGIFTIYKYDAATVVNASIVHYVFGWAAAIGFKWSGLDSTGNGEWWGAYAGSTHGEITVWRRGLFQQCPIGLGFCTDYYPYIHLKVFSTGAYTIDTSIGA
jgi:hypothetical protein